MKKLLHLPILLSFLWVFSLECYLAFVCKPIVDILTQPVANFKKDIYSSMPYSWEVTEAICPRVYQLLLHEIVDVIEEHQEEVKILVPRVYYIKQAGLANEFYTLKENILPVETLYKELPIFNSDLVKTLRIPFESDQLAFTLSAGTQLVVASENNSTLSVYFFNNDDGRFHPIAIPESYFFKAGESGIADFIALLRTWVETSDGFIPYVWGGASFSYRLKEQFFLKEEADGGYWLYQNDHSILKSGFDCSAMILRAAHICGLPFIFRNSATMAHFLKKLTAQESIENGDILYFRGHVCVVSDVAKNMCIEARGYTSGFGKIHEIQVSRLFKNIATFDDLKDAYLNGDQIELLNIHGKSRKIFDFKILKLKSIFYKTY